MADNPFPRKQSHDCLQNLSHLAQRCRWTLLRLTEFGNIAVDSNLMNGNMCYSVLELLPLKASSRSPELHTAVGNI